MAQFFEQKLSWLISWNELKAHDLIMSFSTHFNILMRNKMRKNKVNNETHDEQIFKFFVQTSRTKRESFWWKFVWVILSFKQMFFSVCEAQK